MKNAVAALRRPGRKPRVSALPRPPLALLSTEPLRAAAEFLAYKVRPMAAGAPRGDGHPVIIFPGLASDGHAVRPLRDHCEELGYVACDWGRGWNTGPRGHIDGWLGALADDVSRVVERADGRSPTLIGWSLGGIYARELAKLPQLRVRQVITIGTPFSGAADSTHAGWVYRLLNGAPPPLHAELHERLAMPPPVPTTSIYSRSDGIVAWQACVHQESWPQVQDIEVEASHLGMGWNPAVLRIVADRLAQPVESWQRYRAPSRQQRAPRGATRATTGMRLAAGAARAGSAAVE